MSETAIRSVRNILDCQFTKDSIKSRPKRRKTGFKELDKALGGGISSGLIVLGASPGLGKSTFALQLAENIALSGTPVLYFSLEMPAESITAKCLSRQVFKKVKNDNISAKLDDRETAKKTCITASDILNSDLAERLSDDKWQMINAANKDVGCEELFVVDNVMSARGIVNTVQQFIAARKEKNLPSQPLVIIDYLQIIPPERSKDTRFASDRKIVEDNLDILVQLAHGTGDKSRNSSDIDGNEHEKIPVLLISSLNRESYASGPMQMNAFKETGGIEYAADILLGLQFTACHEKGKIDINEQKDCYPRDVEITVIKQRFGSSGSAVRFNYYAEFDYFEENTSRAKLLQVQKDAVIDDSLTPKVVSAPEYNPVTEVAKASDTIVPAPENKILIRHSSRPIYINNTMVANEIRKGRAIVGEWNNCDVSGRKQEKIITKYRISESLSRYDCDVADAVYTLYKEKQHSFTLSQLLKVLTGDERQTVTKQKKQTLAASVDKLMRAEIEIDCSAQLKARSSKKKIYGSEDDIILGGRFLNVMRTDDANTYSFITENNIHPMPLYDYGEKISQMIRFPAMLLSAVADDGRKITDTTDTIKIKHVLIQRLEIMRNRSNNYKNDSIWCVPSPSVNDTSVLAEIGVYREQYMSAVAWRKKCCDTIKTADEIMKYFCRIGYISSYSLSGTKQPDKYGSAFRSVKGIKDPFSLVD